MSAHYAVTAGGSDRLSITHNLHTDHNAEFDIRDACGDRYPGLYRFAKMLERTARGIQSGAIPVPGGRQAPSRQTDPLRACRELAAGMDLRMRQLAEEGVPTQAIIGRMTGHLVDLQKIWTSTTDEQLDQMFARDWVAINGDPSHNMQDFEGCAGLAGTEPHA